MTDTDIRTLGSAIETSNKFEHVHTRTSMLSISSKIRKYDKEFKLDNFIDLFAMVLSGSEERIHGKNAKQFLVPDWFSLSIVFS